MHINQKSSLNMYALGNPTQVTMFTLFMFKVFSTTLQNSSRQSSVSRSSTVLYVLRKFMKYGRSKGSTVVNSAPYSVNCIQLYYRFRWRSISKFFLLNADSNPRKIQARLTTSHSKKVSSRYFIKKIHSP